MAYDPGAEIFTILYLPDNNVCNNAVTGRYFGLPCAYCHSDMQVTIYFPSDASFFNLHE
jgi:hypothetical protein